VELQHPGIYFIRLVPGSSTAKIIYEYVHVLFNDVESDTSMKTAKKKKFMVRLLEIGKVAGINVKNDSKRKPAQLKAGNVWPGGTR
jgi:hypothetical protein